MRGKYYYMSADDEKDRVRRTLLNEQGAFIPLFHKYKAIFFSNLKTRYHNFYTIDETQDMSLQFLGKISTKLHQYDPNKAQFSTWITSAMNNFFIDCYRKKMKTQKNASLDKLPDVFSSNDSIDAHIEREKQRELIAKMLNGMDDDDVFIFEEVFVKKRKKKDIAKDMGLKRTTFDYRVKRFKKRLEKFKPKNYE